MDKNQLVNFLILWFTNAIVLLVLSLAFGGNVVLGNDRISRAMASVFSAFLLTGLVSLVVPVVERSGLKVKNQAAFTVFYFIANFLGVWVIKTLALVTGLGVASILFVLIVAVVVTVAQWGVNQLTRVLVRK